MDWLKNQSPNRIVAPFRYYGGKGNLAKKIVPFLPEARVYVEPFCGAASMFWHLPDKRFPVRVLNDLNGEIINLFRVLQDPETFEEFKHRITYTPYSLDEFRRALSVHERANPVERAWAFFVRQNQGFGGIATCESSWGKVFTISRGVPKNINSYLCRLASLEFFHERLMKVQLDSRDALDVIRYWDSLDTSFYLDPPYVLDTRAECKKNVYKFEMDDKQHHELIEILLNLKGNAVLSGYSNDIYNQLEHSGWQKVEFETSCHAAVRVRGSNLRGKGAASANVRRTEVLWIKSNRETGQGTLFG